MRESLPALARRILLLSAYHPMLKRSTAELQPSLREFLNLRARALPPGCRKIKMPDFRDRLRRARVADRAQARQDGQVRHVLAPLARRTAPVVRSHSPRCVPSSRRLGPEPGLGGANTSWHPCPHRCQSRTSFWTILWRPVPPRGRPSAPLRRCCGAHFACASRVGRGSCGPQYGRRTLILWPLPVIPGAFVAYAARRERCACLVSRRVPVMGLDLRPTVAGCHGRCVLRDVPV